MLNDEDYKEFFMPYVVCVIFVLILLALLLCFVPNHRSGDAGVGERIDAATAIIGEGREQQQAITSGIEAAEREANNIGATINQSYRQAERAEAEVTAAGEAISECRASIERCQQLVSTIKARAKENAN